MTLPTIRTPNGGRKQQGIVLVVSLLILVVMTVLGVSMLSSASLGERMASNLQGQNITFQAAESCLRETLLPAPAPGNTARRDAVALGAAALSYKCNYDSNSITASVTFASPTNAEVDALRVRGCDTTTCSAWILNLASNSGLNSGAKETVQITGIQIIPKN